MKTLFADLARALQAAAFAARLPDAGIVIPGHRPIGGRERLDHTTALAEAARGE